MIQKRNTESATDTPMRRTVALGVDFWNDSCDLEHLAEAVREGAVGATSNPVIVQQVVHERYAHWKPVLGELIAANPTATEDEIAWSLIGRVARDAAAILAPVHQATAGHKGYLSVQVNPKYHANTELMVTHARVLSRIAPNVAIKVPATSAGIAAMEKLTGEGIRINATVCFSVPQAVACAEAVERGLKLARSNGVGIDTVRPNVTIMVGRIDDHLRRVLAAEALTVDPGHTNWAGVAIFKRAWQIFQERRYRSTLLAAAYRYHMHWSQLVGDNVAMTMPYATWKQFNASGMVPERTIDRPVDDAVLRSLQEHFLDFRRAWEPDGMTPAEFQSFGASVHTLDQFLGGYQQLLELVRGRILQA